MTDITSTTQEEGSVSMNTPGAPTAAITAAERATKACEAAADARYHDPEPVHTDLAGDGRELTLTLEALEQRVAALTEQVGRYGDHRLLTDDTGAESTERLATAVGTLAQLGRTLANARRCTERYESAIGHVHVAVDLNAGPE